MEDLKPLATDYSVDCDLVADIEKSLPTVTDAASAAALAEKLRTARNSLRMGGKLTARLDAIERQLIVKGAKP